MYIRFENGYPMEFSEAAQNGFDEVSGIHNDEMMFLIKDKKGIRINEAARAKYNNEMAQILKVEALKAELIKIKEDIEQVSLFDMVRADIEAKRARAAEIVNELRAIEGKQPREITH